MWKGLSESLVLVSSTLRVTKYLGREMRPATIYHIGKKTEAMQCTNFLWVTMWQSWDEILQFLARILHFLQANKIKKEKNK